MNELVVIDGKEIERIEYSGQPVLTFAMVDTLHERREGAAGESFRDNRDRFVEGVDFVKLPYDEWSALVRGNTPDQGPISPDQKGGHRGEMHLLFLSGYLKVTK